MGYRELIKKVQVYSGFSDKESKDALNHLVESLAVHLNESERKDFASQLPQELQNIALAVWATEENSKEPILQQFMKNQHIKKDRAKKQILSAWKALKESVTKGQIEHIKAQLSKQNTALLH